MVSVRNFMETLVVSNVDEDIANNIYFFFPSIPSIFRLKIMIMAIFVTPLSLQPKYSDLGDE